MKTALRGISGMAAMTGRTYSDIGNIFTKVAGNGRLMSQELLQFSASGLNAAATLTEYLNKNKKVRESVIGVGLQSKKGANDVKTFAKSTKLTLKPFLRLWMMHLVIMLQRLMKRMKVL